MPAATCSHGRSPSSGSPAGDPTSTMLSAVITSSRCASWMEK
ncbi:MAG: hypothetical protein PGN13_15245 [Patulibacter minatonensis]